MTLMAGDLTDLVKDVIQIDSYKSKMGDDADIVVVSFDVKEKGAAEDLVSFVEKGYKFVLDADTGVSDDEEVEFKVYVELDRDEETISNILEMMDGVSKLTNTPEFKFQYYKSFKTYELNEKTLKKHVAVTKEKYNEIVTESNMNNFKNFFNKSYLEEVAFDGEILVIKKAYADPLAFEFVDFGDSTEMIESINESFNFNDFGEIIFLCKYIGDYNITKYGNKLVFENAGKGLVLRRL